MSVLDEALKLRAAQRAPMLSDYGAIILRFDSPKPGDAAKLLEIMDAISLTQDDVKHDIVGAQDARGDEAVIAKLEIRKAAIAQAIAGHRKKLAEMPTPGHRTNWGGQRTADDALAASRAKVAADITMLEGECKDIASKVETIATRLTATKAKFSRVYGVK